MTRFARPCLAAMVGLLSLLASALWSPSVVLAQTGEAVQDEQVRSMPTEIYAEQKAIIDSIARQIDDLAARIDASADNDGKLVDIRGTLEQATRDLLESGVAFRPRLTEINSRLEQIGAPPADGQPPEPDIIARERADLAKEKAEINAQIGVAESLSIRVSRLIERIGTMRRDLFTQTLSKRYDISTALNATVWNDFDAEISRLYRTVSSWWRFVVHFKLQPLLGATLFSLAAAAVLLFGGRRFFGDMIAAVATSEQPSYLSRLSVAFWSTLLPSAALTVFLGATYFSYSYFAILRDDIAELLSTLFQVIIIVVFINRLALAALSPRKPEWRLVLVDSPTAARLFWLVWLTAVVTGIDFVMNKVNAVMASPLSLTIAKSLIATVVVGILVVLIGFVKLVPTGRDPREVRLSLLNYLAMLLGFGTMAAALLGYIGLARFLSQQIVVTGAILATMYIGFLSAGAMSVENAFAGTALGRYLKRRFLLEETTVDQFGLATSIATYAVILSAGVPLILLQWGFQWADITTWTYRLANEIRIGSVSFSLVGIVTGIIVFVFGYFLTRGFQGWLDGSVMARGRVDAGVRNSIRTAVGYAGVVVAGLIGVSAAGIDLSSFALVAGALSLGVGFGLQNIVSNFVSGLILLAERPFKVGDWIVAGATSGTVKRISVRATEIETFQRQTVILPNSDLINSAVGNWTHRNKLGRLEIRVGVAYNSDVRRVHAALLGIVTSHPMVLKNPEPFVLFTDFGDAALIFEARMFLADITNGGSVQNDIRFAIMETFEREGIVFRTPPTAINVVGADPAPVKPGKPEMFEHEDGAPPAARRPPAPPQPTPRGRRRRKPDPDV